MGIENRFRQAAYSYILGGSSTVLLTLIFLPVSHYRGGVAYIIPGIIFLIVIGCFIYKGYRLLTRIIAILATGEDTPLHPERPAPHACCCSPSLCRPSTENIIDQRHRETYFSYNGHYNRLRSFYAHQGWLVERSESSLSEATFFSNHNTTRYPNKTDSITA